MFMHSLSGLKRKKSSTNPRAELCTRVGLWTLEIFEDFVMLVVNDLFNELLRDLER